MLGTKIDTRHWPFPQKAPLAGEDIRLVPLETHHHADLWPLANAASDSFTYLRYGPFETPEALSEVIEDLSSRPDQPFWAVITPDGRAKGWLSICDVSQSDGAFEIGSIWFSPALQGTRAAREAIFLLMCLGMDTLSYERLVWRCQAQNEKSRRAALNLGFTYEGTWRNAIIIDGWQRDVAWFSILKHEWPSRRRALAAWMSADNFDATGQQKRRLQDLRT